jgi:hypothetical protein
MKTDGVLVSALWCVGRLSEWRIYRVLRDRDGYLKQRLNTFSLLDFLWRTVRLPKSNLVSKLNQPIAVERSRGVKAVNLLHWRALD